MGPRIIAIAFLILLVSCGGEDQTKIPEHILLPPKMTDVLVDVHILEASMGLNIIQQTDTTQNDTNLFYRVFENNGITRQQYDSSMSFYMKHPELLNLIYDSVLVKLDKEKKDTLR